METISVAVLRCFVHRQTDGRRTDNALMDLIDGLFRVFAPPLISQIEAEVMGVREDSLDIRINSDEYLLRSQ